MEQAVQRALLAVRAAAPAPLERRVLRTLLAEALTGALQEAHTAWCLENAPPAAPGTSDAPGRATSDFLRRGLGGLERAVLQLELGAARDSSSARAALRLGPAQYRRLRERGLEKLRAAVTGALHGQVCDQHLHAVVLAATGDPAAAERLAAGPDRCRSCARQARGVGGILRRQLAMAPWPLLIKPAGLLSAKLGAFAALTSSGGAGGGATGLGIAVAKGAAAVLAAAAVAGGASMATGPAGPAAHRTDAPAEQAEPAEPQRPRIAHRDASPAQRSPDARPRRGDGSEPTAAAQDQPPRSIPDEPASAPAQAAPERGARDLPPVTRPTVERLERAVDQTRDAVPAPGAPEDLDATLDEAARAVEELLPLP